MPNWHGSANLYHSNNLLCQLGNVFAGHSRNDCNLSQNIAHDWYTCVFFAGIVSLLIALEHQNDGGMTCSPASGPRAASALLETRFRKPDDR
jgi:hypothetical protein